MHTARAEVLTAAHAHHAHRFRRAPRPPALPGSSWINKSEEQPDTPAHRQNGSSINPETLRGWVTQAEIDDGSGPGTSTSYADKIAQIE